MKLTFAINDHIFSSENEPDDNKDKLDYAAPDG